jgi:hypothetical protein
MMALDADQAPGGELWDCKVWQPEPAFVQILGCSCVAAVLTRVRQLDAVSCSVRSWSLSKP